jgi:hypothetical protein
MMNEQGKSDRPIVPKKSPNKSKTPVPEEMEGRGLAKGNLNQQNAIRTQSRVKGVPGDGSLSLGSFVAPSELAQKRQTAKSNRDVKFTALMHHIYRIDTLWFAYSQLKRHAAAGVDSETWRHYGEAPEDNLQDFSPRVSKHLAKLEACIRAAIRLNPESSAKPEGNTANDRPALHGDAVDLLIASVTQIS